MSDIVKVLQKVAQAPGLCSSEEINMANEYYTELVKQVDIFKRAHNHDIAGLTAHSYLDKIQFYVNKFKENNTCANSRPSKKS